MPRESPAMNPASPESDVSDPKSEISNRANGPAGEAASFAETALRLGGKSDEEARRTGAIDKADEQVEALFATRFQTASSPVHRAVWDRGLPVELFVSQPPPAPPEVERVMQDSLERGPPPSRGWHAARRKPQAQPTAARRSLGRRLLGTAGRSRIWRRGGSVCRLRPVSHADGAGRSDRGGPRLGAWLHRGGRSGAHVRHARAEAAFPAPAGQRRESVGLRTDRAGRRLRSDGAQNPRRAAGG